MEFTLISRVHEDDEKLYISTLPYSITRYSTVKVCVSLNTIIPLSSLQSSAGNLKSCAFAKERLIDIHYMIRQQEPLT